MILKTKGAMVEMTRDEKIAQLKEVAESLFEQNKDYAAHIIVAELQELYGEVRRSDLII